jgi:hypothetical protein
MREHVRFYRFITPIYPRCVIAAKFRENSLYRGYSLTRVLRSCLKIDVYELRVGSYAGLHCVVIKGYSKSAGYQPGVCFEDNRFRNSWNAVYVAGAWRFVQCNWGARHLVNAKEVPRPGQAKAKNDSLRCDSIVQR